MRSVGICAFVAVLLLTSSVCAAQVFLKDHSGLFVSDTISDLELTAEGIAATISTLGGRSVLTIDANAATQVCPWLAAAHLLSVPFCYRKLVCRKSFCQVLGETFKQVMR